MTVYEYGKSRLFDPVGMDSPACGMDPQGICDGGNGFSMNVYDMAKFGQLCLNGGVWAGEQIVPAELRAPVPWLPLLGGRLKLSVTPLPGGGAACPHPSAPPFGAGGSRLSPRLLAPPWGELSAKPTEGGSSRRLFRARCGVLFGVPGGCFWHWPRRGRFRAPGRG